MLYEVITEKKKAVEESVSKADKVKEEAVPVIKTDKNTEKPLKNVITSYSIHYTKLYD